MSMAGLQRIVGNRALQAAVTGSATLKGPSARKHPRVQRLWTKDEFKDNTDAGILSGRGKTLKQVEKLLDEYHGIRKNGMHLALGSTQDRAINILYEIVEDVTVWQDSHEGDTSRSKKRIPGLVKLKADALRERIDLEGIREKSREFTGETPAPVTRTENKFKTQMEGDFSSILTKLGPVLSTAAPASGDTAEVEVAVKIPVEPSGVGYIGFRVKASIERLKKKAMKVRFELAVTGGAKIPKTVEAGGELGMYIEAQGGTPEKALELVSYGVYRRFRESKIIPNEIANFIWGGSGTAVGWNRSEKWAAKVEKENFKNKTTFAAADSDEGGAFVETGALIGGKAKGGVGGVAELEGTAQFSTGQHYDEASVKGLKGKYGGELGKADKMPTVRGQTHHIGESVHHLDFGFSATGGPFSGGLKVGIDWSTEQRNKGLAHLQSLRVGLEASATLPMSELVAGGVIGSIPPMLATVIKGIRKAATGAQTDKNTTGQNVGEIVSGTENGVAAVSQLSGIPKTAYVPKFEVGATPPAFSAPVSLKLSLNGTYDFTSKKFLFEFKIEYIKGIDIELDALQVKIKKGQRLVRFLYDGGWTVD